MTDPTVQPHRVTGTDDAGAPVPLGWSLRDPFVPGTNLRGAATGGTLAFALPSLAVERIACLGEPPAGTRTMLHRLASSVTRLALDGPGVTTPDAATSDVLWVSGADGPARLAGLVGPAAEALLSRTPSIVIEDAPTHDDSGLRARLGAAGHQVVELDTLVIDGEVRAVGPRTGDDGGPGEPVLPGVRRPASRPWPLRRGSDRSVAGRALIATRDDPHDPPGWLMRLATDHGHDVHGHGWSIAAPGVYDSQKVLVYLTPPGEAAPTWIVKITRDARHAARLRNEARALEILAGLGPIEGMTVPRLVAAGDAGRLASVIETIVPGRPFEPVLRGPDGLDRLRPALEALGGLAERSAHDVPAGAVAATFERLRDQYVEIHRPTDEDRGRLDALVARVAAWPTPIPLVAMHGDPGTWNLLAGPDDRIGFLDWESFDPDGLPLWDLFHMLHAAVLVVGRTRIPRRRMWILASHVFEEGRYSGLLVDAVQRYRERIGVPPELVEPLFTFCWIHRALKESARRRPDDVARGHYARFAQRIVASPTAPTLRRLYGEGASA
jgi:Phosphotransferase enzyme family